MVVPREGRDARFVDWLRFRYSGSLPSAQTSAMRDSLLRRARLLRGGVHSISDQVTAVDCLDRLLLTSVAGKLFVWLLPVTWPDQLTTQPMDHADGSSLPFGTGLVRPALTGASRRVVARKAVERRAPTAVAPVIVQKPRGKPPPTLTKASTFKIVRLNSPGFASVITAENEYGLVDLSRSLDDCVVRAQLPGCCWTCSAFGEHNVLVGLNEGVGLLDFRVRYEITTLAATGVRVHPAGVSAVAGSGNSVWTGGLRGALALWDLRMPTQVVQKFDDVGENHNPVTSLVIAQQSPTVCAQVRVPRILKMTSGTWSIMPMYCEPADTHHARNAGATEIRHATCLLPPSEDLWAASTDSGITIFDVRSGRPMCRWRNVGAHLSNLYWSKSLGAMISAGRRSRDIGVIYPYG